jgi:hypothetical protein
VRAGIVLAGLAMAMALHAAGNGGALAASKLGQPVLIVGVMLGCYLFVTLLLAVFHLEVLKEAAVIETALADVPDPNGHLAALRPLASSYRIRCRRLLPLWASLRWPAAYRVARAATLAARYGLRLERDADHETQGPELEELRKELEVAAAQVAGILSEAPPTA